MAPLTSRRLAAPALLLVLAGLAPLASATGPVAQVRVAFDRQAITATAAAGLADVATGRQVGADDPVRVASISKLVVAIGVLRLVEAGALDLEADVSTALGWELRNPAFPDTAITLRMLLSHTSSLTDEAGYWQVPLDGQLRQLLADPRAWDRAHAPGTFFRYTNLNFPLVASLMERASGERFDRLMQRLVLQPLALDACFGWATCSQAAIDRAVVLYEAPGGAPVNDDLHGRPPACPVQRARDGGCDLAAWTPGANGGLFSPQGGLRISANGLARIGRLLLGDGEVDGVRLLTPESVRAMIGPEWSWKDGNGLTLEEDDPIRTRGGFTCRYGLAVQTLASGLPGCGDDPFGDGVQRIGHSGNAYGLLAGLWVDRKTGTGVVYFSTGNDAPAAGEHSAFSRIEETSAAGW